MRLSIQLVALLLALGAGGCQLAAPEATIKETVHASQDVAATYDQTRLRMRAFVGPLCGEIEQAADRIIVGTKDAAVRRAALQWKIDAVPALRAALFQPDPYTALFDSWVLCWQMTAYFETGPGRVSLGDSASIAAAACRHLEEQIAGVAAAMSVSGDVTKGRALARQWAEQHPIRGSIAGRETTLSRVLERDSTDSRSVSQTVAEVTTSVDDLNRRLEVYSDQLFRQARWEAELFQAELLAQTLPSMERAVQSAERAAATVDRLAPAIERATIVAENAPAVIAAERATAIQALQDELTRTLRFVQEERVAVLTQVSQERIAALQELHTQLIAERQALTADLKAHSFRVVDRAFWRAAQLLAAALVSLAIGAALILRIILPHLRKNP